MAVSGVDLKSGLPKVTTGQIVAIVKSGGRREAQPWGRLFNILIAWRWVEVDFLGF